MKLLLIIAIQLLYVPMLSLRTISMVKNLKFLTSIFGFFEASIYIFGLAIVLSGDQNILEMITYAIGFSLGLVAGIIIEQKLAIGYSSFHVNINHKNPFLVNDLREKGYGVTVYVGQGRNGERLKLDILTKRKKEQELLSIISSQEPNAFIIAYEPKMFKGGYLSDMMKKRMGLINKIKSNHIDQISSVGKTIDDIKSEVNSIKSDWKNQ